MLPAILAGASLLGSIFGKAGKGAADQRMSENKQAMQRDRLNLDRYNSQQQAILQALLGQSNQDTARYNTRQQATTTALGQEEQGKLNRAQLGMQSGGVRAHQSILGSLMKNLQPVSVQASERLQGRVPQITGGLTPAALDPMTRQHGDELMKAALMAQLTGSDVPEATDFRSGILNGPEQIDFRSGVLTAPELTPLKQSGKLEKILGTIGLIGSAAGAAGQAMGQKQQTYEPGDQWGYG